MIIEETLLELLPGFNCGSCGYVNCAAFASALKEPDGRARFSGKNGLKRSLKNLPGS